MAHRTADRLTNESLRLKMSLTREIPLTTVTHLMQHYARLATEQLLNLRPTDLPEDARQALQAELETRCLTSSEAKHLGLSERSRFKSDMSQLERTPPPPGPPFAWLDPKPSHHHHMGQRRESQFPAALRKLQEACASLQLNLPSSFLLLMESPALWQRFRSMNDGFFEVKRPPVKCPLSDGYLVPFISDQQYCHFYFLHLARDRPDHEVVWADDLYYHALYTDAETFEKEYKDESDASDIYLCNRDFERFMYCHFEDHEKWFESAGIWES